MSMCVNVYVSVYVSECMCVCGMCLYVVCVHCVCVHVYTHAYTVTSVSVFALHLSCSLMHTPG